MSPALAHPADVPRPPAPLDTSRCPPSTVEQYRSPPDEHSGDPVRIGGTTSNAEESCEAVLARHGFIPPSAGNAEIYKREITTTNPVCGVSPSQLALIRRADDTRNAVRDSRSIRTDSHHQVHPKRVLGSSSADLHIPEAKLGSQADRQGPRLQRTRFWQRLRRPRKARPTDEFGPPQRSP